MVALLSVPHFLAWRRRHVDDCTSRILFTRKTPDTTRKAIRMPELVLPNTDWKLLADRGIAGFTRAEASAAGARTRQSVGTPSIGLDEPAAAMQAQRKSHMRYMTFLALEGCFPVLRLPSQGATPCLAGTRSMPRLNPRLWRKPLDGQQRRCHGAMVSSLILS